MEPMDVPRTAAPARQVNQLKRTEIGEEECGLKEGQSAEREKEPNESRDHFTTSVCQPSKMSVREEPPTTFKCSRKYHCKSEPDRIRTRKNHNECDTSEETFQENVYSDKQQRVITGEIKTECLENVEGDHLDTYRCDRPEEDPKDSASGESHVIQSEGRMFECSQCGKGFPQRRNLMIHQKSPTGEKLYKCSQCGNSFSQRRNLSTHQRLHTGAKPYKCSHCGKYYSLGKYLKRHQSIHTGAETKGYKCSQCGKSFNQEKGLLVHRWIHTGEKPYECSQCGKCFNDQRNLMRHRRIHTGEKRYTCLECGKSFVWSNQLKIHHIL
nr:zinc finger protein 239-like [Pogona vitticeps]